jgi:hypothetical protein
MDFIEIGGRKRPVRYGWNALAEFGKLTGIGLNDIAFVEKEGQTYLSMQFADLLSLIYVGLKYGARKEGEKVDFTVEDIGDWMDNEDVSKMHEFINLFVEQMPKAKKKES